LGRLGVYSGQDICGILARQGFVEVCRRGSHVIMQKRLSGTSITVPVPDHRDVRQGTLQSIIRQSELSRKLFEVT
jgi:predicted RNA binding protein YcfA (HicA-like mRNA interferase family)